LFIVIYCSLNSAQSVEVVAGAHNIRQNEPSQVTQTSTDFTVHENWGSFFIRNDVAIIRLPEPLVWTGEHCFASGMPLSKIDFRVP
jgi:hypothetical protein